MALIKCPECNKEISDKANTCPNCGMPLTTATPIQAIDDINAGDNIAQKSSSKITGTIVAIVAIIGIIIAVTVSSPEYQIKRAHEATSKAFDKYHSTQQQIDELEDKYNSNQSRINDIRNSLDYE